MSSFLIPLLSPILVLAVAAIVYWKFRLAQATNQRRSLILFVVGVVLTGGVASWAGIAIGIEIFCFEGAGAQCGLMGFFVTGPLALSVAVAIYLWLWARRSAINK
jgi:hypothetical protein